MSRVIVDTRYTGAHGIARYSREVIQRLPVPWQPLHSRVQPLSPWDVINHRRFRLERNDLLYSPGFSVGITPARQLVTVHDLIHLAGPQSSRLHIAYYNHLLRPIIRRVGHVMTVSETSKAAIQEWISEDKVVVHNTGNGCSAAFRAEGTAHSRERPYFLFVGNLKWHKNARLAFAAMRHWPDHELLVVTSDRASARRLAVACSVQDRVSIVTGVEDAELASYYRGCEALLFPSIIEGFGLPVLEALRCHARVVYVRSCLSVAEICGSSQVGIDDPGNDREFAEAMASVVSEPFAAPALQRYNWNTVGEVVGTVVADIATCG